MTLCLALPAVGQGSYIVMDLGTLPGYSISIGKGINNSGQVTGFAHTTSSGLLSHSFVISTPYTTMIDIGILGGTRVEAHGINDSGQVTGLATLSGDTAYHAFVVSAPYGTLTDLGTLGGPVSGGYAINASGQVTGFAYVDSSSFRAFIVSPPYTMPVTGIGTLGGSSVGWAIDSSGRIVGDSFTLGNSADDAFLYSNGTMTDLGTFGGSYSFAYGINSAGQITGMSSYAGDTQKHAFLISGGTMTDIGTLGGSESLGFGINTSGQAVGVSTLSGDAASHAFLYSSATGLVDLNTLIPANSGWTLNTAWAINDSGQITGEGINPNGDHHAFLLTPSADLAISKVALPAIKSGRTLSYFIVVTNNGPNATRDATVTDSLPDGTTFVSAGASQGACNGGATVSCDLGTLAVSSRAFINVTVQVTAAAGSRLSNTATVFAAGDGNAANNSSTAVTRVH